MDVAGLIVAILALITAALAAKFTHAQAAHTKAAVDQAKRSADAAVTSAETSKVMAETSRTLADIEAARAHEQRHPRIALRFHSWLPESGEAVAQLVITNDSAETVAEVTLEVAGGPAAAGFLQGERTHTIRDLAHGVDRSVGFQAVARNLWPKATVSFVVSASDGQQSWEPDAVAVKLPSGPMTILTSTPK